MTAPRNPKRARKKEQRRLKIEEEIRQYQARRRKKLAINAGLLAVVVAGVAFLVYKGRSDDKPDPKATPTAGGVACKGKKPTSTGDTATDATAPPMTIDTSKTYVAVMKTSCGTIEIELDDEKSPNTVNSFVALARKGFYDGLIFHRLVKEFALQGGDPQGDGTGGPNYKVVDAPPEGFKYAKGVVAMAKGGGEPPGTAGSQFFIVPGDGAATLPAEYAVLGIVIKGDAVVAKINNVPTADSGQGEKSKPLQTVYIEKVTIRES